MLELVLAAKAELDLLDIWEYIAEDQPLNADRFLDRLNDTFLTLAETPTIGSSRPDLGNELLSFPFGNYIIYYRQRKSSLEIARVLSSFRDIDQINW